MHAGRPGNREEAQGNHGAGRRLTSLVRHPHPSRDRKGTDPFGHSRRRRRRHMQISNALESAPFSPAQRGWLDGFLSGVLGLEQRLPSWQPALEAACTTTLYDRRHPYPAEVLDVHPLTAGGSAKDVRFVAFDLRNSGLTYKAGDSLGIYPENCPELVDLILTALGATGDELVAAPDGRRVPARDALTCDYAITCSSDRLLTPLASSAADPGEARRLRELVEDDADGFLE